MLLDLVRLTPIWTENHHRLRGRLSRPVHGRIDQCCRGEEGGELAEEAVCSARFVAARLLVCGTMSTHARVAKPCEHHAYTTISFAHVWYHCV